MDYRKADSTAILLTFPLLNPEQLAKIKAEIDRMIAKDGGRVYQSQQYNHNAGGVVIYQP